MNFDKSYGELKLKPLNSTYKRVDIEGWLHQYEEDYKHHNQYIQDRPNMRITYREGTDSHIKRSIDLKNEIIKFLDTYKVLLKVAKFYKDEHYFKEQVELYKTIKNDVSQLNSWLEIHKLDEGKRYAEFVSLFQEGYRLEILHSFSLPIEIKLDESEFKHRLEFLGVLERSTKIVVIGTVRLINDLEVIKMSNSKTYKRKCIVISIDDGHASELLVRFVHKKVELIKSLNVGQKVKVYCDLLGGEDVSNKTGYSLSLLGWSIEVLK